MAVSVVVAGLAACTQMTADSESDTWGMQVVTSFAHDPSAFTQGLAIHDGQLYEGTGQYGGSSVRRVDIESGLVEQGTTLGRMYFGEGITILGDRLYQLTWRSRVGFIYDVDSLDLVGSFRYDGEGWGLTHDGTHLILSDGTASLRYLDPNTFSVVKQIDVHASGQPVDRLNELEYINGEIWANIWFDERIARISPDSGEVLAWLDLSGLYPASSRSSDQVLNGIAFDPEQDRLFVTGKNWPRLYEIEPPPR